MTIISAPNRNPVDGREQQHFGMGKGGSLERSRKYSQDAPKKKPRFSVLGAPNVSQGPKKKAPSFRLGLTIVDARNLCLAPALTKLSLRRRYRLGKSMSLM